MNSNIIKNRGKKILLERVFQGPVMHLINGSDPQVIAISFFSYFVVLFLCFPLHELAHATTAYKLGDTSQKWNGGLSPNPIDHIDLIGALVMLIFPIGWAKPVMTDTRSFKKPRRDTALVSLAGPLTNLILAFIFYIIFKIMLNTEIAITSEIGYYLLYAVSLVFQINACLAIFNLLPIPPFDGFGILQYFLNEDLYHKIRRNQQVISIVILMLLFLTDIFSVVINVFLNGIIFLFDKLTFFM